MTASAKIASLADDLRAQRDKRKLAAFGRAVSELREQRDISRQKFAKKIGLSYSNTANIELGHNWPSMPVFIRICEVLEVELPGILR